jgi:DNA modification methylase
VQDFDKIIHGSTPESLRPFPDEIVDLTVTSPPYDDLRNYDGDYSFDFENTAKELYRITKPGGVVVWVVADATHKGSETLTSLKQAVYFKEVAGFKVHDTMIYHKANPIPLNHNRYEQTWEYMFIFSKGRPKTFNAIRVPITSPRKVSEDKHHERHYTRGNSTRGHNVDKIKGNIWTYKIGGGLTTTDKIAFKHPALFPDKLAEDHILTWSNPGDLVLDPFCGSGTTLKVAKSTGRFYLGVEYVKEYIEIAEQRLMLVS